MAQSASYLDQHILNGRQPEVLLFPLMGQFPTYLGVNFRNSEFLVILHEIVVAQFRSPSLIYNLSSLV